MTAKGIDHGCALTQSARKWIDASVPPGQLVGPIDVTGLHIDADAIGEATISDNGLAIGAIGIHRVNAVPAQFENEQSAGAGNA
jgi:hypothetical protein